MSDVFALNDRTALVTGAGRGLGAAIARSLAGAGASVWLNGRDPAALEPVAAAIDGAGGRARALPFDITDAAAVPRAFADIEQADGGLDILVNCVGARDRRPIEDFDADALRRMLEVNLVAAFGLSREAAGRMVEGGAAAAGRARIIHVTSIAGHIARAGDAAYTASKAGLTGLVRALAAELGPRGITVNAVAPGYFATEANREMTDDPAVADWLAKRTSLGRWGQPEEIAGAVRFLASDAASYVTGQVLAVDGGYLAHF